ncbi:hypothetical protein [Salipiger mucosus]|uniref:Uncharacterized protein n=1 Tax=Salipiger mucosus DSM 16094 TaxID=1123237 RepID=S9SEN7_9RHOB|nr:hypothetical protein [Salipiger mucosus]EPX84739.1 hypothetical protein Salmuc_01312 [Salipiger mucosus DSM 16094]
MFNLHKILLVSLLSGLAGPALAEREVHVVSVGDGHETEDYYALPEARIMVDRRGVEIGLVLLDNGELHWKIEATTGTIIGEIIRSGPGPRDSEVTLNGIPVAGVQVSGLPLAFRPLGREFRTLVDSVTDIMATERLSSFQGVHKATDVPVRVDYIDTRTAGLTRDYLSQRLGESDDLPPKIRDWDRNRGDSTEFTLVFDENGITLSSPTGTRRFAVAPDVTDVLLPAAAVYDPGSQMIYCVTYGDEGYLYSVDVQTGSWAVVTNLDEYDAAGLLYDPENRLLIATGAFSRPGEIKIFGLDGSRSSIFIPTTGFPGLTDLFDYGNEHGPPLTPHVFSNGWLLLEAVARGGSSNPVTGGYRIYAVQVDTGEVRLLHYSND